MIKFFARDPRRTIYVLLALVLVAGLYFSAKHLFKTDEDVIREVIRNTARAVEKKDIDALGRVISSRYRGFYGTSKAEALNMARSALAEADKLSIKIDRLEIQIKGREADVVCYFYASGLYRASSIYNAIPFRGIATQNPSKADRADILFEKDADRWLVYQFEMHVP